MPAEALVDVFAMADIFVLPSRSEAFPRVLIEAMAAGLAVVTTDAPGCRDVVEGGRYGRMARVDDASDLARQTATLLDDPGERARLAEQAGSTPGITTGTRLPPSTRPCTRN